MTKAEYKMSKTFEIDCDPLKLFKQKDLGKVYHFGKIFRKG